MPAFAPKDLLPLLKETFQEWTSDKAPRLGAALAYYTVFSLAPLLLIVIFIVGLFWGHQDDAVRQSLMNQIGDLMGPQGAEAVGTMLENVSRPGSGVLATVLGTLALLFGATGVFVQLQGALNTIWDVQREGGGVKGLLVQRAMSFGMILVIGFLLLVSLVASALISQIGAWATDLAPGLSVLIRIAHFVFWIAILTGLFAFIYRYLPDVEIAWSDVWTGALLTAVLFALGKFLIGLYLGRSSVGSAYGAAGSLVVLLVWVYYSAQIVFFGAELTQVYARRYGSQIEPSAQAVRIGRKDFGDDAQTSGEQAPQRSTASPDEPARLPSAERTSPPLWKRAAPVLLAFVVGRMLGRRSD